MQKPSERYKLTSDNNIITFKKPVHDPFNTDFGCKAAENRTLTCPSFSILFNCI